MTDELSIQETYLASMACFGCGPANPKGLQLKSYPSDEGTRAVFQPWPEHDNGLGFLNGGIICTVLDCHSATPMFLEAVRMGLLSDWHALPYVTAGLDVRYLRPTPLDQPSHLRAWIVDGNESQMTIEAELWADDKVRATALATWKRWKPRTSG